MMMKKVKTTKKQTISKNGFTNLWDDFHIGKKV